MRAFKVGQPALAGHLVLATLVFFVLARGARSGGHHWDLEKLRISGTPATTDVTGQSYSFTPIASVPGRAMPVFAISGKPAWASFDRVTGTLAGTPTPTSIGTFGNIVISVSDGLATSSLPPFAIAVFAPPDSPAMISGTPPASLAVGSTYSLAPMGGAVDAQPLSFTIRNQPAWASFSPASASLYGTADSTDAGTYSNIATAVNDGLTSVLLPAFSITVDETAPAAAARTSPERSRITSSTASPAERGISL